MGGCVDGRVVVDVLLGVRTEKNRWVMCVTKLN